MSDFASAFEFTMASEDPRKVISVVSDPIRIDDDDTPEIAEAKTNAKAIGGCNNYYWPDEFREIAAAPPEERRQKLASFYLAKYWTPARLGDLASQPLANRVYDMGVNGGMTTAVRLMQEAVNELGNTIGVDGHIGPVTLAAVNACEEDAILCAFKERRIARYNAIFARIKNPTEQDRRNLQAWLARAER